MTGYATRLFPLLLLSAFLWPMAGAWAAAERVPPEVAPKVKAASSPVLRAGDRRTPPEVKPKVRDWRLVEQVEVSAGGGVYHLPGKTLAALVDPPVGPPPKYQAPRKSRRTATKTDGKSRVSAKEKARIVPQGGWKYVIQVAAYRGPQSARSGKKRLKKAGFPAYILSKGKGKRPYLRLRAGPFPDRAAAKEARRRIARMKGFKPGRVIKRK